MDGATPGETGEGAQRRSDPDVESQALAKHQKKARRKKAWIVFQDESGVTQKPPVRRTWAPCGETPVLTHCFNWKKLSISAALAYRWDGSDSRLFFQTRPGSYDTESLIAFLDDLHREFPRKKLILIWDGLPAHKSRDMKSYLEQQRRWLEVELLPGYAPDLNPVELLWGNVKGNELANGCPETLLEAARAAKSGLRRVARHLGLALSFLRHAGFSL
jgi:transposase